MGTKNNPSKFDCYKNAEPDEPMFVLLARDKWAAILVRLWVELKGLENDGVHTDKTEEALTCADNMEMWREEHIK